VNEWLDPAGSDPELLEFLRRQRWFGVRGGGEGLSASTLDVVAVQAEPRPLDVLVVEVRCTGSHDLYQLLAEAPDGPGFGDVFAEPGSALALLRLVAEGATASSETGTIEFRPFGLDVVDGREERVLEVEQSNSSVVLDERLIVKLYRRLEAGINPELELLRFLADHRYANAPRLEGWWSYTGSPLTATLGILLGYLPGATDGWSLALADAEARRPEAFLVRARRLGEVVGELHAVLASDAGDPAFAPEEASTEALALVRATVDDEIQTLYENMPDDEAVAPIARSGDAIRDLLGELASFGPVGRIIRVHGDLHLGQVLWARGDWYVVDFEGEPARTLPERRLKRSPLRDVAGMLRSFDYAARAAGLEDGEFQSRARDLFLEGYLGVVERTGILPSPSQSERLIEMFELEKAVYELRYELAHRPDWVHIPVAGIERLLERAWA
jgi:trehalose synthase-fused probable maltokinase